MIQPNFNLMLWFLFIIMILSAFGNIVLGALGVDKSTKYGNENVVIGIAEILVLGYIAVG